MTPERTACVTSSLFVMVHFFIDSVFVWSHISDQQQRKTFTHFTPNRTLAGEPYAEYLNTPRNCTHKTGLNKS